MKVEIESSSIIKPSYESGHCSPPFTTQYIPLSVFDNVTFCGHMAVIYAYRPPTPPNAVIKQGLERVLSIYREWAGRLGKNSEGENVIFLNDEGVRLVEASVEGCLGPTMQFKPSPFLLTLHPSLEGGEELVQVQLTRFGCGSLVVGFTTHHFVADGQATSNFLVAWGKACRGVDIGQPPMHDRTVFIPRDLPMVEHDHNGIEYLNKKLLNLYNSMNSNVLGEDIVVTKVHFTLEFLSNLKNRASSLLDNDKKYSTFESLLAHLWRCQMKARGLEGNKTTQIRISVNGRTRLNPMIPNNYFGNLVLWAFPKSKVKDLLQEQLPYATKVIHDAVSNLNGDYFQSFIDYASTKLKEHGSNSLVPSANLLNSVLGPNLEVHSWLGFPFFGLDFGCGSPYMFMPSYVPTEDSIFLLPSFMGDGSIDAFVPTYKDHVERFIHNCYQL
ncbi:hypothetical protein MLD38_003478 [Melastoma candidum]|uniref:Uncharacterized protein n=1 Tax=Melastoma candidum TaxID=119954 RepID=A0ACB9S273_9MYRT|nr:hypothetical protein MLD38_003478 [Melastoma candidum]